MLNYNQNLSKKIPAKQLAKDLETNKQLIGKLEIRLFRAEVGILYLKYLSESSTTKRVLKSFYLRDVKRTRERMEAIEQDLF
jgi:CRISPR/Cas system-associated protein Csx1